MRALVQRVTEARVRIDGAVVGEIGTGLCVLVGVTHSDDDAVARKLAEKVWHLRVFPDDAGTMNVAVADAGRSGAGREPVHALREHRARPAAVLDRRRAARGGRAARRARSPTRCATSARPSPPASSAPTCRSSWSTTARDADARGQSLSASSTESPDVVEPFGPVGGVGAGRRWRRSRPLVGRPPSSHRPDLGARHATSSSRDLAMLEVTR